MSRHFLTHINLNKNELQNAAIQALGQDPQNPTQGQIYFSTNTNSLRQWTGSEWIDYLNSADGSNYIESVDANFVVTDQELHLADTVTIDTSLTIGGTELITGPAASDGNLTVKNSSNEPVFVADAFTSQVSFYSQDGNLKAHTEASNGAGAFRIVTTDDFAIRSTNGDIILYPGEENGQTGKAFVGWGNGVPDRAGGVQGLENEITTAGNSQTLTNKTLDDVSIIGTTSFKGGVGASVEYLSIEQAYTGTTRVISQDDISIRSVNGDIILYPGSDDGGTGKAYIGWGDDNWGAYPEREIATKGYVDGVAQGLDVIESVYAATSASVVISALNTSTMEDVFGVAIPNGGRVLIKNQVDPAENGIYVYDSAASGVFTLSTLTDDTDLRVGSYVLVTSGDNAATGWIVTSYTAPASTWTQFSAANEYTAGTNIEIVSNEISISGQIPVGNGGTGASDAAGAKTNLGFTTKYSANNPELTPSTGQIQWIVNHQLGTSDVIVQVKDLATLGLVEVDVYPYDNDNVALEWVSASVVLEDAYRVVVIG